MALVSNVCCKQCGKTKYEVVDPYDQLTCNSCRAENADMKKREYLAGLKELAVEERLGKIEEWIYDRENKKVITTYC